MRQWMMCSLALVLIASTSGCAKTMLTKEGYSPQQFEADKFDCEQKVVTMYGGYAQMGMGHAIMAKDDMRRCLFAKGYREMTEEEKARTAK